MSTFVNNWLERRAMSAPRGSSPGPTPGSDGLIWMYFDVEDTSSPTVICYNTTNKTSMEVDGVSVPVATSYQFSTAGRHLIKMGYSNANLTGFRGGQFTEIYFPATITTLGYQCLYGCTKLESLTLPYTMTMMSEYGACFTQCTALRYVDMSSLIGALAETGFEGNTALETVLAEGATSFGPRNANRSGFDNSPLKDIYFGENLTFIGTRLFSYCSSLEKIIIKAETPPELGSYCMPWYNENYKIYVPYSEDHSVLAAYQADSGFSAYSSKLMELNQDGTVPTS